MRKTKEKEEIHQEEEVQEEKEVFHPIDQLVVIYNHKGTRNKRGRY